MVYRRWSKVEAWQINILLALVLLVAFALRISHLDTQSFWWDEVFTVVLAHLPLPNWVSYLFWDDRAQTPGFFALMSLWAPLGENEFVVRYVSALCGTVGIPLIYLVGRRIGGWKVGIFAAFLLALSPLHLWYSQEARVYALQASLGLASGYFFLRLLDRPNWREILVLALTNALGLYFHYLFAMVILAQMFLLILLLSHYPAALRSGFAANALAGILFSPWLVAIQMTGGFTSAGINWVPSARWYDLVLSFYAFVLGSTNYPRDLANWLTPLFMVGFGAYAFWVGRKGKQRTAVIYLLLWIVVPIGMAFLVSLPLSAAKRSIYVDRYMLTELPPLLVLIALGARRLFITHPRLTAFGLAIAMVPILFSLWNMYFDPTLARVDWRGVGNYVATYADQSQDRVAIEASATLPYSHYDRVRLDAIAFDASDNSRLEDKVNEWVKADRPARLWLFTETVARDVHGFQPTVDERMVIAREDSIKRSLDERFHVEREMLFQGVLVTLYRIVPSSR